jgi:hypothetical protein
MKRLFQAAGAQAIESIVNATPTGTYARRIWFLYEWLLAEPLALPNAQKGTYARVVDIEQQWAVKGETSPRHRVWNNLPGTPAFCPLVFRTKAPGEFAEMDLAARAQAAVAAVPRDLLARTAAFLLLKDSKSSYAIEGERPAQDRIQRWGRATRIPDYDVGNQDVLTANPKPPSCPCRFPPVEAAMDYARFDPYRRAVNGTRSELARGETARFFGGSFV